MNSTPAHPRLSVAQRMVMGSVALELSVPNAVAMAWEKPLYGKQRLYGKTAWQLGLRHGKPP